MKNKISPMDKILINSKLKQNNIKFYKHISLFKKVVSYSLIAYGVITLPFPTGSQVAIVLGALGLGIPRKTILSLLSLYTKKILFFLRVLFSFKRLKYELKLIKLLLSNKYFWGHRKNMNNFSNFLKSSWLSKDLSKAHFKGLGSSKKDTRGRLGAFCCIFSSKLLILYIILCFLLIVIIVLLSWSPLVLLGVVTLW